MLINGTFEGATRVETEHNSSEKFRVPQLGAIRVLRTIFQGIHNLRDEVARGRPEAQSPTSLWAGWYRLISVDHNVLQKIQIDPNRSDIHNLEFSSIKNALMFECRNRASFECQGPTQTMVLQRKFSDKPAAQITQSLPEPHKTFGTAKSAVNKRPDKAAMINELLIVPNGGRACFPKVKNWLILFGFNFQPNFFAQKHCPPVTRSSLQFLWTDCEEQILRGSDDLCLGQCLVQVFKGWNKGWSTAFSCVFLCFSV